jgi:hypothetical protein
MQSKLAKLSLWTVSLLFVVVLATSLSAVAQSAAGAQTITGCVQKGLENTGYYLVAGDKHYELYDDGKASIADHVGQKVTVSGSVPNRTAAQEEKSQPYEKKETGKNQHSDFQVTSLTVVSPTCK